MKISHTSRTRIIVVSTLCSLLALTLTACAKNQNNSASATLTVGTTDKVTSIDPAGSYDNGSFVVMNQVYPFLVNTPYGSPDVKNDIAESATFTSEHEFTVTLKSGLTFANGHALTSSDVKFTFDRQLAINDPNGPASLLANLESVSTPDKLTVVFTLKQANDQSFAQVLSSPAGPIVDEEVFSATKITPDKDIVKAEPFAGQYTITSYDFNNLIAYKANPHYQGLLGKAATEKVNVKYFAESANLKLEVQKGGVDVAFRSLSATDTENLRSDKNVKVVNGPGGEIRYIVFNFNSQPYGATSSDPNPSKALAVRQAAADLIDREAIAKNVYKNTYTSLFSYVPAGLTGATEALKSLYGDGNGGPSLEKAKARLASAGVAIPVPLSLQYNGEHYGPQSGDEYALVKDQLENGGLFAVKLQQTEYVQYSKDRVADIYPAYQLGWFPDYSDADNYLSPFFIKDNFLGNHFDNPQIQELITKQLSETDQAKRTAIIEDIQAKVAAELSTLPILQGAQVAVVGKTVKGTEKTLDASFKFRYAALSKG